mmetsp:Transcript_8999/g.8372  ORF Transcript_8999/g.8372 Transcript_8999/m.8372 type:complete len:369 (-) Transcript_8999:322-1428(-)
MRFVRVQVYTEDEATILITLSNPEYPEYEIENKTSELVLMSQVDQINHRKQRRINRNLRKNKLNEDNLTFCETGRGSNGKFSKMKQKKTTPYAVQNKTLPEQKVLIKLCNKMVMVNLGKRDKPKQLLDANHNLFRIDMKISGFGKKIIISRVARNRQENVQEKPPESVLFQSLKQKFFEEIKASFLFKGLGISVVDDKPREILFMSFFNIKTDLKQGMEARGDGRQKVLETLSHFKFSVQHIQIDNCLNISQPIIMAPQRVFHSKLLSYNQNKEELKQSEEEKQEIGEIAILGQEDIPVVPFLQINISFANSIANKELFEYDFSVDNLRSIQVSCQNFQVYLETPIILNNYKYIDQIQQVLLEDKTQS